MGPLTQRYSPKGGSNSPTITTAAGSDLTYKWDIKLTVNSRSAITHLEIPSHKTNQVFNEAKTSVNITLDFTDRVPNKDFVLFFRSQEINQPQIAFERYSKDENDILGVVSFFPDFNSVSLDDAYGLIKGSTYDQDLNTNSLQKDIASSRGEFIFIADRSGSMSGDRIINLISTLEQLVKSLPVDSYYNIYSFGSSMTKMYA